MRHVWVSHQIDVPSGTIWRLLVEPASWPEWGPSVRAATTDADELDLGTRGTVHTVAGLRLPFEITRFEPGRRWAWSIAGVAATDHVVEALDDDRSRVSFGTPWPATAYLMICRLALTRLDRLATESAHTDCGITVASGESGVPS